MKQYLIALLDIEDKIYHLVWCKNLDELVTFLTHLDKDQYTVCEIQVTDALKEDWKEFCKFEDNLEHGKKEE